MTRMQNARLAGTAYLSYIVVGMANEILASQSTGADGTVAKLSRIAEHATDVRVGVILKLCECFCALVLAVSLYAITRDQDHELAILGLVCRVTEGVFIASLIPNALGLLSLAELRAGTGVPDVATTNAFGAFLQRPDGLIGAIFYAVGSAIFSYLLLWGRMIPVPLARWGLFASTLLVIGLPLQLVGFLRGPLTGYQWVPALIFAPVFALWLLIKGVATTAKTKPRVTLI